MDLKCKVKTLIEVEHGDFEIFINNQVKEGNLPELKISESYGFELACDQECGNDVSLTFNMDKEFLEKYPLDEYDLNRLKDPIKNFKLTDIMQLMATKKLIKYGEYLVKVSW